MGAVLPGLPRVILGAVVSYCGERLDAPLQRLFGRIWIWRIIDIWNVYINDYELLLLLYICILMNAGDVCVMHMRSETLHSLFSRFITCFPFVINKQTKVEYWVISFVHRVTPSVGRKRNNAYQGKRRTALRSTRWGQHLSTGFLVLA